ncbi:hypothetical protein BK703_16675 [Bacillus thuringiensis serovar silo]|uniref:hypothetical protein n=1 Tax=Bacillus thuringiensis TaxID=1428 RepID=UPI000A374F26|nr:hypothetical protein [Bacillus thuringiensis]MED3275438.1 hypothetical protein [Bacillus thuringiensis]OTW55272.1 hypothetical protein BK703_16675 [Bacillus thuringiensis serovar silo]OTW74296.1 hypothetical protein BK700_01370 [Bacillus thuringiensis serovar toguchini]
MNNNQLEMLKQAVLKELYANKNKYLNQRSAIESLFNVAMAMNGELVTVRVDQYDDPIIMGRG